MNWIITPDKYLTKEETKRLRNTCHEAATIAKSRGVQAPPRDFHIKVGIEKVLSYWVISSGGKIGCGAPLIIKEF